MDENIAPVAARASMSWRVQSQISTSKPASAIRWTRSVTGRSRKTISAQTASRIAPPPSSSVGTAAAADRRPAPAGLFAQAEARLAGPQDRADTGQCLGPGQPEQRLGCLVG